MGTTRIVMTVAGAALVGAAGAGVAQASPTGQHGSADTGAPSACRPANHQAKIVQDSSSAGHRHYRVTLTAGPKTSTCKLAGSPSSVRFYNNSAPKGVSAKSYGPQHNTVRFGPGHPVHFDIQVPNSGGGAPANTATFTLNGPDGEIPGRSEAHGGLAVDAGTKVGPVQGS